jgi:phage terminase Nu1 subunit (DNA packaging protein)
VREKRIIFSRLTQKQIADIHGVTTRTVRRWLDDGLPVNDDGSYDASGTISWRLSRESSNPAKERADLDAARRRKLELEIEKLEGSQVSADEAREFIANMTSRARARLLAVPASAAGRANPDNPKQAEQAFSDGIHEALTELADDPFGSGSVAPPAKANGQRVGGRQPKAKPGKQRRAGEVAH